MSFRDSFSGKIDITWYTIALPTLILAKVLFKKPIFYGQPVEVGTRVTQIRVSSFLVEQRIEAGGQLAALSQAVVVRYDYEAGVSVRIPDEFRTRVETFEGREGGS